MKWLVTLLFAGGLVAACDTKTGGGSDGMPMFRASCQLAQNKPAPELKKIALQLPWFQNGEHSYTYLGNALGIFGAHGFDVEIVTGKGSDIAARALAAGNVDAAIVGGDALVLVAAEGGSVQSIGAVYRDSPVTIYSLAEKGITKPEHLYGKKLGLLPGSNTVTQYEAFAELANLDRDRIQEVSVNPQEAPRWVLNSHNKTAEQDNAYLDALVHYRQFEPLGSQTNPMGANFTYNRIDLRERGLKIYGMMLALHPGRFTRSQTEHLKQAVYDAFACARADPKSSIDALAKANPDKGFGIGEANRLFGEKQLEAMIEMACEARGAACEGFLAQEDAQWYATFDTMQRAKMISIRPDINKIRTKVSLHGGIHDS